MLNKPTGELVGYFRFFGPEESDHPKIFCEESGNFPKFSVKNLVPPYIQKSTGLCTIITCAGNIIGCHAFTPYTQPVTFHFSYVNKHKPIGITK